MRLNASGVLDLGDQKLEYKFIGPQPDGAPTLVMLHEGLGCVGLWDVFPDRLAAATGAGVFVYSRAGYGASSPIALPRPLDYMQAEAIHSLPRLLDAIGFQRGILIGHSDGGSIAAVHAGATGDARILGASLIAPHFFVEDFTTREIAKIRTAYETTNLRDKLARWHADVDGVFFGWNDAWLDPAFKSWSIVEFLPSIRVPVQIVQGEADPYGTLKQIEMLQQHCGSAVEAVVLPNIGHAPHREAPDIALAAIAGFCNARLAEHGFDRKVGACPA